jgi:hypothetical protein
MHTALALVLAPSAVLVLAGVGFALRRPVAGWYGVVGGAGSAVALLVACRSSREELRAALAALLLATLIASASLVLAGRWYDTSYDGLAYHDTGVVDIARGWNPWRSPTPPTPGPLAYQREHFPKGPWAIEAVLMRLAGRLEPAKALNLWLAAAAGLAAFVALRVVGLRRALAGPIAACLALNPVATCQSLSFCVDGQVASAFTALLAFGLLALARGEGLAWAGAAASTQLLANAKLTGGPYALILWIALVLAALLRRDGMRTRIAGAVGAAACALALLFTGYNPYVTNTLRAGHPLYPAAGPYAIDFVAHSRPPGFGEMNRFERLGRSLFSASSTEAPDGRPRLKLPFTVVGDEATKFHDPEVKVSGFGPFFGGALVLSVVAFLLARGQQGTLAAGLCGATLLGTVLLTAEGWWARIAPQLWLVPFVLALPALVSPGRRRSRAVGMGVLLALLADVAVVGANYVSRNRQKQARIRQELADLRRSVDPVPVYFGIQPAVGERLTQGGVRWREVHDSSGCGAPMEGTWFTRVCRGAPPSSP